MTMASLAVGCGSGSSHTQTRAQRATRTLSSPATPAPLVNPDQPLPSPGPTGHPAATTAVDVIRGWADALRHGDVRAAARYFALPSVMINGTDATGQTVVIRIVTDTQAEVANATLPCGARLLSADQRGRYVNALFRLTGRPGLGGTDCGVGAGTTARTNFVIAHGRIVEWLRAPDDPGDNKTPGPQPAPAPSPSPSPVPSPGPARPTV
jgi:hypothetical protein